MALKTVETRSSSDRVTDVAWLSSARVVRCWVKSRNERNPRAMLLLIADCRYKPEEGGDDVKSAWLLRLGLHTRYNGRDRGQPRGDPERIPKPSLSSDGRLQPACLKSELLVTACQHSAVNMFPGLVHTARHVMGADNT
jgi:hypothetical protein